MRIIAGNYRGKKLFSPLNEGIRPTADRARESLFNMLNSRIENSWQAYRFLDVFAGTGACGLEALSRGAERVAFIDHNPKTLRQNAGLFPQEKERIKIVAGKAEKLPQATETYNLFFLDPPYKQNLLCPALKELAAKGWLEPGCLGAAEIEKSEEAEIPANFTLEDQRLCGAAKFIWLRFQKQ